LQPANEGAEKFKSERKPSPNYLKINLERKKKVYTFAVPKRGMPKGEKAGSESW